MLINIIFSLDGHEIYFQEFSFLFTAHEQNGPSSWKRYDWALVLASFLWDVYRSFVSCEKGNKASSSVKICDIWNAVDF